MFYITVIVFYFLSFHFHLIHFQLFLVYSSFSLFFRQLACVSFPAQIVYRFVSFNQIVNFIHNNRTAGML